MSAKKIISVAAIIEAIVLIQVIIFLIFYK